MSDQRLKVLFLASEVNPFSKTGGLADVSDALPRALTGLGLDVLVLSPRYGFIDRDKFGIVRDDSQLEFSTDFHGRPLRAGFSHIEARAGEPKYYFIECDPLYDRPGIYVDPFTYREYIDNDYRFILLCRAAFELCRMLDWTPDVFHCNDWQTGIVPLYLNQQRSQGMMRQSRSILTIHNIAYHGLFGPETIARIGQAEKYYHPGGPLEFYTHVSFLKAGLEFSDRLNTVSPTYAREIPSSYEYGYGLETVLRARGDDVAGILNGIDVDAWNPQTDPFLFAPFSVDDLEAKETNKRELCASLGLTYKESLPVLGIISRMASQKGYDILLPMLADLLRSPVNVIVLGSGDLHYEYILGEHARMFPRHCAVRIGYDEALAHRIEGGADIFLMPSKYEPCGLNQMMSMHYGTIPVVRATGGLADTVIDADSDPVRGTGFRFDHYHSHDLLQCIHRALTAFHDRERWKKIQRNAMQQNFSWNRSARLYSELYRTCLSDPPRVLP
jgi:starch synthase